MAKQKPVQKKKTKITVNNSLLRKYNIKVQTDINGAKKFVPAKLDPETNRLKPVDFPSSIQKALEYFESDYAMSQLKGANSQDRLNRYRELEFMVRNEGLMSKALQTYVFETTQADEQDNIISIVAKKDITEHFYQWLHKIGLSNNILQSVAYDITLYADSFLINSIDLTGKGVVGVQPISVFDIVNRLEFSASKMNEMLQLCKGDLNSLGNVSQGIKDMIKAMKDTKNTSYADWYKSYLFGFVLKDVVIPPWGITHMRRFTTALEFFPFGRPLFIGSIARYKSYKTTEMLVALARVASFPKEVYSMKGGKDLGYAEIYQAVNKMGQMIENTTIKSESPDELAVGEKIITFEDMFDYKIESPNINPSNIADLTAQKEDLTLSTGLPFGIFEKNPSFGNSGQSLVQQSKEVARNVYMNQTPILQGLTELYRLHLMLINKFDGENTKFELHMNYPVVEESSDKQRLKSDSIRLANDILTNLGTALGLDRGEALPADIVSDVFSRHSFLNPAEVEAWMKTYSDNKDIQEKVDKFKSSKRFLEKTSLLTEDAISVCYLKSKERLGITEGSKNSKHFFTSSFSNPTFENTLKLLKDKMSQRLKEKENKK